MTIALSPKDLIRRVFSGIDLPRVPFIPWIYTYAAKLEQVPVKKVLTDPAILARSLQNAQKLFGYDAIVCNFDFTIEAEACGCDLIWKDDNSLPIIDAKSFNTTSFQTIQISEIDKKHRLPTVLEAMRQIKIVMGQSVALVVVLTGPVHLAAQLMEEDINHALDLKPEETKGILNFAGKVVLGICKAFCELQPDIVAVMDQDVTKLSTKNKERALPLFKPIGSLIRFFNAHPILITKVNTNESLEIFTKFNMDGVMLGGEVDPLEIQFLKDKGLTMGIGIPSSLFNESDKKLEGFLTRYIKSADRKNIFLCTEGEVPFETQPESIHNVMRTIARL